MTMYGDSDAGYDSSCAISVTDHGGMRSVMTLGKGKLDMAIVEWLPENVKREMSESTCCDTYLRQNPRRHDVLLVTLSRYNQKRDTSRARASSSNGWDIEIRGDSIRNPLLHSIHDVILSARILLRSRRQSSDVRSISWLTNCQRSNFLN